MKECVWSFNHYYAMLVGIWMSQYNNANKMVLEKDIKE